MRDRRSWPKEELSRDVVDAGDVTWKILGEVFCGWRVSEYVPCEQGVAGASSCQSRG